MAKDPAFLFYPNDWLGGTMGMSFEEKGAYLELLLMQFNRGHMTEHMARHMVGQIWDKIKDKFSVDDKGLYYNRRLKLEHEKRKKYSESRKNNINGANQYNKKRGHTTIHMTEHMARHMENGNENINTQIQNILKIISETTKIETKGDDKFIAMIVLKMIEIFKKQFPKYPVNVNFDYPACLQIAYKIAELKKWKKVDVVNGKLNDCLKSWEIIVEFVSNDDWLCTRSIPDINSDKEWARLVQKMAKVKKKSDEPTTTAPRLTHLEPK